MTGPNPPPLLSTTAAAQQGPMGVRRRTRGGCLGEHLDYSYGVAVGDYDNDGHPDIFIANTGNKPPLHKHRKGTLLDVTGQSGLDTKPPNYVKRPAAWSIRQRRLSRYGGIEIIVVDAAGRPALYAPRRESYCHPDVTRPCSIALP